MSKHVILGSAVIVTGLLGLGCAGLNSGGPLKGGGGGIPGKEDMAKLKLGHSDLARNPRPDRSPSGAVVERGRRKDLYIVKFAPGIDSIQIEDKKITTGHANLDRALAGLGVTQGRKVHDDDDGPRQGAISDELGLKRTIRIHATSPADEVVAKLEAQPEVDWVEPVREIRNSGAPNDPYWKYQWHMQKLHVDQAWKTTMGKGVVVAVVDTGVTAHEDGFFNLMRGKDFIDGDNRADDENGHGSHVAGTIGQASNNGVGTVGVAPQVSILPVRVLDANGSGDNTTVAKGIIWAVDHGANVINLSLGSPADSQAIDDAISYAYENDVTVVAATGNDGFTDFIGFPAQLDTPIAVGAIDYGDKVTFYSNQGKEIDLVAPGGDTSADLDHDGQPDGVLQETKLDGVVAYHYLQGTSMATPHVAGCAALVYANGVHDPDDIKEALTSTAKDLGARGWDPTYGFGLVDPVAALGDRNPRNTRRGNGGNGGDDLQISQVRVRKAGDSRAVINWKTNEPAKAVVKGDNAFERRDTDLTKLHQVVVRGKPGDTVKYTLTSAAGQGDRDREVVTVTF